MPVIPALRRGCRQEDQNFKVTLRIAKFKASLGYMRHLKERKKGRKGGEGRREKGVSATFRDYNMQVLKETLG